MANATLQQCFRNFCEFSKNHGIVRQRRQLSELQMNNFQFAHLCKDAGFAEPAGRLHREAIDVIFVRAAPTGKRLISFKVRRLSMARCLPLCAQSDNEVSVHRAISIGRRIKHKVSQHCMGTMHFYKHLRKATRFAEAAGCTGRWSR